ncbi:hypothetical protein ACIA8O_17695 [Kitasatospora sp. NPDC051853]|uniref:hypothetical protein n=1 Tax=Kitasatospora sp. NPDC051853 TaxID=3364058 RepID=UPI0037B8E674
MTRTPRTGVHCPVCGLDQGFEPWGADGLTPSFVICDCCSVEFGYEDSSDAGVAAVRVAWVGDGCPWRGPVDRRPEGWDPGEQLANGLKSR